MEPAKLQKKNKHTHDPTCNNTPGPPTKCSVSLVKIRAKVFPSVRFRQPFSAICSRSQCQWKWNQVQVGKPIAVKKERKREELKITVLQWKWARAFESDHEWADRHSIGKKRKKSVASWVSWLGKRKVFVLGKENPYLWKEVKKKKRSLRNIVYLRLRRSLRCREINKRNKSEKVNHGWSDNVCKIEKKKKNIKVEDTKPLEKGCFLGNLVWFCGVGASRLVESHEYLLHKYAAASSGRGPQSRPSAKTVINIYTIP